MSALDLRIPRVAETPRRSMQRLGLLKLVVSNANRRPRGDLLSAGEELIRTLGRKVTLPLDDDLARYIRSGLAEPTHPDLRRAARQFQARDPSAPEKVAVEIQDAYLSLGELASRRGRLAPTDDSRFPHWATTLGLVRKEPFAPLVRGQLLLSLVGDAELNAFSNFDPSSNPLELTRRQRLFFLYALLERDLSIVVPLFEILLSHRAPFSDLEAGDLLPEIYLAASKQLRATGRRGHEADWAAQLTETAEAIGRRQGKSYGKTVREQTITPRLEPFVDLGVLTKANPYSYEFEFTTHGRQFFTSMIGQWREAPLFPGFGRASANLLGYGDTEIRSGDRLSLVHEAWDSLKSSLGYSPIDETLLLALILGLEQGAGWIEFGDTLAMLKAAQKDEPGLLRFNIDRQGKLAVIRFLRTP